jgi:hypothetical protein
VPGGQPGFTETLLQPLLAAAALAVKFLAAFNLFLGHGNISLSSGVSLYRISLFL